MIEHSTFFSKRKRLLLTGIAGICILFLALYLYVLLQRPLSKTILANTNSNSLIRFLSDEQKTAKWWNTYSKSDAQRTITHARFLRYYSENTINVQLAAGSRAINSEMRILPAGTDSSFIRWQVVAAPTKNPIRKIREFFLYKAIGKNMQKILLNMKTYTAKSENIYDLVIERRRVTDTLVVVTGSVLEKYPTTSYIYDQIARLRRYLQLHHVKEKSFPMLHVHKTSEGLFETDVGLPVDKMIDDSGKTFVMQRMIPGDILVAECTGGPAHIEKALAEMENYMLDYQKNSPAIPFELMVTDRLKQPDTSKWISYIYYPVY